VSQAEQAGGPYQVIVAPLLVEFGLTGWVDRVLVVDCPAETQLQRLLARDGGDEAIARAILATQASREQRLAAADDVIVNDGSPEHLPGSVATLDAAYREMAAGGARSRPGLRLP
jgi:dephospho-CoA kinase